MNAHGGIRACLYGVVLIAVAAAGPAQAAVDVVASVSGVQKGGDITFTATTDESDPVVKVTFTYEGTASSDENTTSPYQVTKAMDWTTMEDLTVTATFNFESIPDQQDTVDVDVLDIWFYGPPQPVRGSTAGWYARTLPTGLSVSSWAWLYDSAFPDVEWTDTANSDDRSIWAGTVAVSGTVQVSATILDVPCTKNMNVTVRARTGGVWVTPVACVEDNEPNWGGPLYDLAESLGQIRDKESDVYRIIVPQTNEEDWSDGVTLVQISSGPNAGVWYVRTNTLEIDMETCINRFAKAGGPPPEPGETNFYDYNNATGGCIANDMADFVQAIKNHEYRGTRPTAKSLEGHFGRIEYELDIEGDPSAAVEGLVATSESDLLDSVNGEINFIETFVRMFAAHGEWSDAGPNWGGEGALGSGKHTRYNVNSGKYYGGCTFGPDDF